MRFNQRGILLLSILLLIGCGKKHERRVIDSGGYFKTQFQDESEYIVANVISDIAEMAYYAKNKKLPDATQFYVTATETAGTAFREPVYAVEIFFSEKDGPIKLDVPVKEAIWSPNIYGPITTAIFQKLHETTNPSSKEADDKAILTSLTEGTATSIEEANQIVSSALQADFRNPGLHEQAAVVLGAFTLRESAKEFSDYRWSLCRMTAHLALARQFNAGASGVNGQLAEVMLSVLMNCEQAAAEKLAQLDATDPYMAKWARVLRAINTKDYREFKSVKDLELFEKIAWFRAFAASVDGSTAWNKLKEKEMTSVADFSRITGAAHYSVSTGHQLLAFSLLNEMKEAGEIYELIHKKALTKEKLVEALNVKPEHCVTANARGMASVDVLGWGLWANFLQRHFCSAMRNNYNFIGSMWGVRETAEKFADNCDKEFSGLYLYPFVRLHNAYTSAGFRKGIDDGFVFNVSNPHLTPAQCWNSLCWAGPNNENYRPNPNPHVNEWHKHNPPPGTAYDMFSRTYHPSLTDRSDSVQWFEKLHQLAPYDPDINQELLERKYKEKPTYAQFLDLYGPVLDYEVGPMSKCAQLVADKPAEYERLMLNAAEVFPDYYFSLGDYFDKQLDDEKAAHYNEKGFELVTDRVAASYHARWLVDYYLKEKQVDKAREVADEAGAVYSFGGLEAKASFLEKTGKYEEAYQWYKNIEERYNERRPLLEFCSRYKQKTGKDLYAKEEAARKMKSLFPDGLEKVTLADFKNPATDGVDILLENDLVLKAGLRRGYTIVALNGTRVHDFPQYRYLRDQLPTEEMVFIVWTGKEYKESKTDLPNHRFNVDFKTHGQ